MSDRFDSLIEHDSNGQTRYALRYDLHGQYGALRMARLRRKRRKLRRPAESTIQYRKLNAKIMLQARVAEARRWIACPKLLAYGLALDDATRVRRSPLR